MPDEPADYPISGWRSTGRKCIVCCWFMTRVEELCEHHSGLLEWRRFNGTFYIKSSDEAVA
jgi:hypothetical protein